MSNEVSMAATVDSSLVSGRDTGSPGFWLSLASDVLNYGASFWERFFGSGTAYVPSASAVMSSGSTTGSTGSTVPVAKSGNGGLIVLGAAVVILLLVVSRIRK